MSLPEFKFVLLASDYVGDVEKIGIVVLARGTVEAAVIRRTNVDVRRRSPVVEDAREESPVATVILPLPLPRPPPLPLPPLPLPLLHRPPITVAVVLEMITLTDGLILREVSARNAMDTKCKR
jgi:hypothetical protein